jgi:hypothetical protein
MSFNYTLKYKTFDQLLVEVMGDFKKYEQSNLIDPQDMIKVAKRVNYDLGLRLHKTKERILEVEKGRVRLPNDFYVLDFALVVTEYTTKQYLPQGTQVEEKIIGTVAPEYQQAPPETIDLCEDVVPLENDSINSCTICPQCGETIQDGWCNTCCTNPESCSLTCDGDVMQLVQSLTSQTRYYKQIYPLRITENTEDVNGICPNLYWDSQLTGVLRDGWLYTSFQTGKVYLNYQGHLENEQGELLVPDHDMLNEYYEYALKQRILENLIMNDEEVNPNKIQLIETRYRAARNQAVSVVNTPNFKELKELVKANRNAMYSKYYDMFASSPRLKLDNYE